MYPYIKLEQEIDLVLEKNGAFNAALQDWTNKWVPIILEYSSSLSGKKATLATQIRKDSEGVFFYAISINPIDIYIYITGESCHDEKAALKLLCMLFQKKSTQDSMVYIYEEYEVRYEDCEI